MVKRTRLFVAIIALVPMCVKTPLTRAVILIVGLSTMMYPDIIIVIQAMFYRSGSSWGVRVTQGALLVSFFNPF